MKLVFLLASGYGNDLSIDKKDGSKVTLIFRTFTDCGSCRIEVKVKKLIQRTKLTRTRIHVKYFHFVLLIWIEEIFGSTRILGRRESLMGECCEANNRPSLNTVHRYYRDCLGQGFSVSVKTCDLHCVPDQLFPREKWREIWKPASHACM